MSNNFENGRYWQVGVELVSGCSPISPGCKNCWSAAIAHRFYREGEPCHESGIFTDDKGHFNGQIMIHPERLKRFNTRKPKVFAIWNDLFWEKTPESFIADVWLSMGEFYDSSGQMQINRPGNTYLVLTKHPRRMLDFLRSRYPEGLERNNVYCGLTVCNQQEADEKIPVFLRVPGNKFLSLEPLLEKIVLPLTHGEARHNIRLVIVGCETGHGARPMDNDWALSIIKQCAVYGIPVFVKQIQIKGKTSKNMLDWPEELRMRELPWVK